MHNAAKLVMYGNSGSDSGKSALARSFVKLGNVAYLDLDTISWEQPGVRKCLQASDDLLNEFIAKHDN